MVEAELIWLPLVMILHMYEIINPEKNQHTEKLKQTTQNLGGGAF